MPRVPREPTHTRHCVCIGPFRVAKVCHHALPSRLPKKKEKKNRGPPPKKCAFPFSYFFPFCGEFYAFELWGTSFAAAESATAHIAPMHERDRVQEPEPLGAVRIKDRLVAQEERADHRHRPRRASQRKRRRCMHLTSRKP